MLCFWSHQRHRIFDVERPRLTPIATDEVAIIALQVGHAPLIAYAANQMPVSEALCNNVARRLAPLEPFADEFAQGGNKTG
jgi:hypothetical protein